MEDRFGRIALIGLGLIGSSIARAVRQKRLADSIAAADASPDVVRRVQELGIADVATTNAAEAAKDADLVILCTPVGTNGAIAAAIAPG